MSQHIRSLLVLLLMALLSAPLVAQSRQPVSAAGQQSSNAEGENKIIERELTPAQLRAVAALDQLHQTVEGFSDELLKAQMQIHIADLLWDYDEARARSYFAGAFHRLARLNPEAQPDADSPSTSGKAGQVEVRRETLRLMLRRDAAWARRLTANATKNSPAADVPPAASGQEVESRLEPVAALSASLQAAPGLSDSALAGLLLDKATGDASLNATGAGQSTAAPGQILAGGAVGSRDDQFQRALWQALSEGDFNRTLSLIESVRDPQLRLRLAATLGYQAAVVATNQGEFDAAQRLAREVPSLPQCALAFAQLATALGERNDFARAAAALSEAEQLIGKADGAQGQVAALLIIAGAAARLDPLRGFEALQSVVLALNHSEAETQAGGAKQEEAHASALEQTLSALAAADFDRALLLAQSLSNRELSVTAQLAACRGALLKTAASTPQPQTP